MLLRPCTPTPNVSHVFLQHGGYWNDIPGGTCRIARRNEGLTEGLYDLFLGNELLFLGNELDVVVLGGAI